MHLQEERGGYGDSVAVTRGRAHMRGYGGRQDGDYPRIWERHITHDNFPKVSYPCQTILSRTETL